MQTRYLEIDDLTDELRDGLEEAPAEDRERLLRALDYSWVHHENALEGNVLTEAEIHGAMTQSVITDLANVTLYKKIRAHFAALERARQLVRLKRFKFSSELFDEFYQTIFMGLDRDKGQYRRDIPLHRTYYHEIAQPQDIPQRLQEVIDDANSREFRSLHPIKQAALFGWKFMRVFPWSEASGVVGRLMSNILLMRAGYFPVVIHAQDRERYYQSLKGTPNDLRDLIVESMENSLNGLLRYLRSMEEERIAGRAG